MNRPLTFIAVSASWFLLTLRADAEEPSKSTPAEVTYHRDIAPLLAKHCVDCHGPETAEGEYRVDTYKHLMLGGSDAPRPVVAGKPDESALIEYLTGKRSPRMPKQRKALDESEMTLMRTWIEQGAREGQPPPVATPTFTTAQIEFFETEIRPLLAKHCFDCHGEQRANGGLAFLSRQDLLDGGTRGPAIVPGQADGSLLIKAVKHDGKLRMPKNQPQLDEEAIALLEKWIDQGAPWPESHSKEPPKIRKRFVIYESDRTHWAFQPVQRSALPEVKQPDWAQDDLDRFILARLEAEHLAPAPAAQRSQLLRRLTFDLIGRAPTKEELQPWLAPNSDKTVAAYVDGLLASEEFGLHWARHWLDNVRFRPGAQRNDANDPYAQWVVRAFNTDMPYDQFVRMQIAGDLLPPEKSYQSDKAEKPDEVNLDGMIAVRPWAIKPNPEEQIDLLGRTFLGMSLFCARCHDHKLEPISRQDYFAMRGIFESTKVSKTPLISDKARYDEYMAELEKTLANEARFKKELKDFGSLTALVDVRLRLEAEQRKLEDPTQKKEAVQKTIDKLFEEEKSKIAEAQKKGIDLDSKGAVEYLKLRRENAEFTAKWKDVYQFDVLTDQGLGGITDSAAPTLNAPVKRGDPIPTDPPTPRRFPTILAGENQTPLGKLTKQSGRAELAQWLANEQHPITARLMVNRIWYYLLGEGLVPSASNFGRSGEVPTNPELLDYLAAEFVSEDWSMKRLIRRIVLSSTYQQSSSVESSPEERDQRLRLYGIARRKRLEVEQLARTLEGLHNDPQSSERRSELPFDLVREMEALFDGASSDLIVPQRTASVSPLQALFLLNSEHVRASTERFALRLLRLESDNQRIDEAYWRLFGRSASDQEIKDGVAFLADWKSSGTYKPDQRQKLTVPVETLERWQAYVQVLLLSNEFLFVD